MKKKVSVESNTALSVGSPKKERLVKLVQKRFTQPSRNEILVCPLGGVGEVGMNWTLYGHAGRWVLVDAGIAFARDFPTVEAVFVDPAALEAIKPQLDAMIVTHAHEDHIGAIHRIWPRIGCPIYATPFAADFISLRLKETGFHSKTDIRVFQAGDVLQIGAFEVRTVHLTHSVPECVGLLFKTPIGHVFHTGDWKFDENPVIGRPTDKNELRQIGDDGVLAMVCDSTNANRPGRAVSEGSLQETFTRIMRDHRKSVIVTCFASNVARVASVLRAATASNRYVALSGRTMEILHGVARENGMLDDVDPPIQKNHLDMVDRDQRVLLCTGTQGEERATMARLAYGDDRRLPPIEPGDVILFSSSVIPGNEDAIQGVKDALRAKGAIIIDAPYEGGNIAASGHAKADEIREMNELIRPRYLIPVHGTPELMDANGKLAEAGGATAFLSPQPGQVISIRPGSVEVVAEVTVPLMCQYSTAPGTDPQFGPWNDAVRQMLREAMEPIEFRQLG